MTVSTFTDRIRAATEGLPRGFQSALARACGMRPSSINDWLSGKTRMPLADQIFPAAHHLGISPEWLATGRGAMHAGREGDVRGAAAEGLASQSGRLDPETLRQAIRFTRTFLVQSGITPDLEANSAYLVAAYEGLAEAEREQLDQIAFMGRMLAKLQGVERAVDRQADRGSGQNIG